MLKHWDKSCSIYFSFSLEALHKALKIVLAGLDVHSYGFLFNIGIGADNHDVGRGSELIDEAYKFLITHNHGLELVVGLDATELELFDDVWNLLEAVIVLVVHCIKVRDHQKGASLKQNDLVGSDCWTEAIQA